MPLSDVNAAAVRRCVDLFNQRTLEWVETCYADDVVWTEMPLPSTPAGQHGGRASLREAAGRVLQFFPDRQMTIRNLVAHEDQVVLEVDWQGTAALTAGPLRAGAVVRLRVVSFFTLANGLIVRQTDYVEPLRA
jgi:steroid delta-isomerase-like uncharacterized protein